MKILRVFGAMHLFYSVMLGSCFFMSESVGSKRLRVAAYVSSEVEQVLRQSTKKEFKDALVGAIQCINTNLDKLKNEHCGKLFKIECNKLNIAEDRTIEILQSNMENILYEVLAHAIERAHIVFDEADRQRVIARSKGKLVSAQGKTIKKATTVTAIQLNSGDTPLTNLTQKCTEFLKFLSSISQIEIVGVKKFTRRNGEFLNFELHLKMNNPHRCIKIENGDYHEDVTFDHMKMYAETPLSEFFSGEGEEPEATETEGCSIFPVC